VAVKHKFVNPVTDTGGSITGPSEWNDLHDITNAVATLTANTTIVVDTHETVYGNSAGSDITFTLPTAVGISGRRFRFMRINSGAGNVIIDGAGSETINGALTYTLTNQYQYLEIESDGSNWIIWDNN
jgi:hypothetical protein